MMGFYIEKGEEARHKMAMPSNFSNYSSLPIETFVSHPNSTCFNLILVIVGES